jgi:hypothetical protein
MVYGGQSDIVRGPALHFLLDRSETKQDEVLSLEAREERTLNRLLAGGSQRDMSIEKDLEPMLTGLVQAWGASTEGGNFMIGKCSPCNHYVKRPIPPK